MTSEILFNAATFVVKDVLGDFDQFCDLRMTCRATKAKVGTAKTHEMTKEELRACEAELADAKNKVGKMDKERKELEDELFMIGR